MDFDLQQALNDLQQTTPDLQQLIDQLGTSSFDSGADSSGWSSITQPAQAGAMTVQGPQATINLGSVQTGAPVVIPRSQAQSAANWRQEALRHASANAGFKVTTKKLRRMLRAMGVDALVALLKIAAEVILRLLETAPRRGARGPFMRTVIKRIRRGHSAEKTLRKWAGRAHVFHHHRAASPKKKR